MKKTPQIILLILCFIGFNSFSQTMIINENNGGFAIFNVQDIEIINTEIQAINIVEFGGGQFNYNLTDIRNIEYLAPQQYLELENIKNPLTHIVLFPNPTSEQINIDIQFKTEQDVLIEWLSMDGSILDVIYKGKSSGKINWSVSNYISGIYLCRITTDNFTITEQVSIIK